MKTSVKWLTGIIVVLGVIQAFPVARSNPPVTADFADDPQVKAVFQRACYNCHSYETRWPWYSRVAPVSWLVAHDVKQARSLLNFSRWGELSAEKRDARIDHIGDKVHDDDMPPLDYKLMHREARLSATDKDTIAAWAKKAVGN